MLATKQFYSFVVFSALLTFAVTYGKTVYASSFIQSAIESIQGNHSETEPPPTSVEIAFSPDGGATDLMVKVIKSAKQTIRVAAYSFTSRPIAKALADARQAGIDVAVVVDHEQIEKGSHSEIDFLASQNVPVRVDIIHALQHDKYMVIDGKDVETGSFNYTAAAEHHNSENALVLWDDPKLAAVYADNWKSLWDAAESYAGR